MPPTSTTRQGRKRKGIDVGDEGNVVGIGTFSMLYAMIGDAPSLGV